jgi:hypothetical protein
MTNPDFQTLGITPFESDLFKIFDNGRSREVATRLVIPSLPPCLEISKFDKRL